MKESVKMDKFKNLYADIPYAFDSESQRMDIVVPDEYGTEKAEAYGNMFPLVLYIHGGSWIGGDKRKSTKAFTFKIPSQGYVLATMNYRLAQEEKWPAQIDDVRAALKFLMRNHMKYGIDPDRIYIWGDSAGAHLAQFAAATLEDKTDIGALISFYGVSDLTSFDRHANKYGVKLEESTMGSMRSPICMLMGEIVNSDEESIQRAKDASPVYQIEEGFPPSLIQHGNADALVAIDQSVELIERIKEKSPETEIIFETFEGEGHAAQAFKSDDNVSRCIDFLDRYAYSGNNPFRKELPEIETEVL